MTPVHAVSEPRPGLAIGAGVLAGLVTLAAATSVYWFIGRGDSGTASGGSNPGGDGRVGRVVAGAALRPGDCFEFNTGSNGSEFTIADCGADHPAQVTATIEHPEAGSTYPGAEAMADWLGDRCAEQSETFIGSPVLDTTLADDALLPDFSAWVGGDYSATCYVRQSDSSSLSDSVEGRGDDYTRSEQVVVSRLQVGDCFVPADGGDSYALNSNSLVELVSCDGSHNGIFFGRDALDFDVGSAFPGEDEIGDRTSERCSELFESTFGVPADGFNYRYWRPNEQSWNLDDRVILCAVLDADPIPERFDPLQHRRFFDLAVGQCFNLGPEETSESLRLDDQVRVLPCDQPHIGQMIGSGDLEADAETPFPVDGGVLQLAGTECERLFIDFVGTSPYESELGNFPFWYPNQPGWEEGDRRYACAFLEDSPRSASLEDAAG